MSPSEVYFWTTLPRIGEHLASSGVILTLLAFFMVPVSVEMNKPSLRKTALWMCLVASVCFWAYTLIPDEKQVQKILTGKVVKDD